MDWQEWLHLDRQDLMYSLGRASAMRDESVSLRGEEELLTWLQERQIESDLVAYTRGRLSVLSDGSDF